MMIFWISDGWKPEKAILFSLFDGFGFGPLLDYFFSRTNALMEFCCGGEEWTTFSGISTFRLRIKFESF
jgi:hypothetical protein